MEQYNFIANYISEAGNHHSVRLTIEENSIKAAMDKGVQKILNDERRRVVSLLVMDCSPITKT